MIQPYPTSLHERESAERGPDWLARLWLAVFLIGCGMTFATVVVSGFSLETTPFFILSAVAAGITVFGCLGGSLRLAGRRGPGRVAKSLAATFGGVCVAAGGFGVTLLAVGFNSAEDDAATSTPPYLLLFLPDLAVALVALIAVIICFSMWRYELGRDR